MISFAKQPDLPRERESKQRTAKDGRAVKVVGELGRVEGGGRDQESKVGAEACDILGGQNRVFVSNQGQRQVTNRVSSKEDGTRRARTLTSPSKMSVLRVRSCASSMIMHE